MAGGPVIRPDQVLERFNRAAPTYAGESQLQGLLPSKIAASAAPNALRAVHIMDAISSHGWQLATSSCAVVPQGSGSAPPLPLP